VQKIISRYPVSFLQVIHVLLFLLILWVPEPCHGKEPALENHPEATAEQVVLGRQIYRQGILANGEPAEARVMGDIKVLGTQFTCLNCHGRSGMGGAEGKTFTLAINPAALFNPREDVYLERSAYDDKTLEIAIRTGKTPEGKSLRSAMPVYNLPEREMTALIAYLQTLSATFSPGLTEDTIHFATIVSENADPEGRGAMLSVLERFFQDKNARTRYEQKRGRHGPFYQTYRLKAYRDWALHVWELRGSPETWPEQLATYYKEQPVFAVLSGMVQGSWQPIHEFCEQNEIPSLLPNTDWPGGIGTDDFYTLYFSEGLRLEARVLAAKLIEDRKPVRVLQIFRPQQVGSFGARSLGQLLSHNEDIEVINWPLANDKDLTPATLTAKIQATAADTTVLWLSPEDLQAIAPVATGYEPAGPVYLSSSLLGGIFAPVPAIPWQQVNLIHPFILPKNQDVVFGRIQIWLDLRKIPLHNRRILGQTYYACMILGKGLSHIKTHFYRDYLLDALDHGNAKSIFSINYPRLSYGPGQRYLTKGAFILKNSGESGEKRQGETNWIVPHL
jgi:mono/diheme cytochrome c family protein